MAGQGLLDPLDARVGDWVRMTVGDRPQILHIVGRSIEPENAGRVVSTSLDTLRENDPRLGPNTTTTDRLRRPSTVAHQPDRGGAGPTDGPGWRVGRADGRAGLAELRLLVCTRHAFIA